MTDPYQTFEADIVQFVRRKFGGDADAVIEQLTRFCLESPEHANARLLRCIVHAAKNLAGIGHYIKMTQLDSRDVITTAEYQIRPGTKRSQGLYDRLHDFSFPFTDEGGK